MAKITIEHLTGEVIEADIEDALEDIHIIVELGEDGVPVIHLDEEADGSRPELRVWVNDSCVYENPMIPAEFDKERDN